MCMPSTEMTRRRGGGRVFLRAWGCILVRADSRRESGGGVSISVLFWVYDLVGCNCTCLPSLALCGGWLCAAGRHVFGQQPGACRSACDLEDIPETGSSTEIVHHARRPCDPPAKTLRAEAGASGDVWCISSSILLVSFLKTPSHPAVRLCEISRGENLYWAAQRRRIARIQL
jgi:hypothetical protein